jgi:hypothetical protein
VRVRRCGSGGWLEAESFEFCDQAAGFSFGVEAAGEEIGAQLVVGFAGGQDRPDDDEDRVPDHDDRFLLRGGAAVAAPFHDVQVVEGSRSQRNRGHPKVRAPASFFTTVSQREAQPTSAGNTRTAFLIPGSGPKRPIEIFTGSGAQVLVAETRGQARRRDARLPERCRLPVSGRSSRRRRGKHRLATRPPGRRWFKGPS